MLIKKGDLIKAFLAKEVDVIIHQANCFNTMKSGFAGSLMFHFPEVAIVDKHTDRGSPSKLGTFSFLPVSPEQCIINMYSQYNYGRDGGPFTDYTAMKTALKGIVVFLQGLYQKPIKVGVPYGIGCGLGGGSWEVVEQLLRSHLSEHSLITLYVYKI